MTATLPPLVSARYWCPVCQRLVVALITAGPHDAIICAGESHLVAHPDGARP